MCTFFFYKYLSQKKTSKNKLGHLFPVITFLSFRYFLQTQNCFNIYFSHHWSHFNWFSKNSKPREYLSFFCFSSFKHQHSRFTSLFHRTPMRMWFLTYNTYIYIYYTHTCAVLGEICVVSCISVVNSISSLSPCVSCLFLLSFVCVCVWTLNSQVLVLSS